MGCHDLVVLELVEIVDFMELPCCVVVVLCLLPFLLEHDLFVSGQLG